MSKVSILISAFESKIQMLEHSIAQASTQLKQWHDNHNGLVGMLHATKEALDDAKKVMDVVAPESTVTEALNIADNIANVIEPKVSETESN